MLCRTFLHVSRIGAATERRLWAAGVRHWDDASHASLCLGRDACERLTSEIESSRAALASLDGRYFGRRLAARHHWRLYPAFRERTAFLDIETTGLSFQQDEITTVALFDGQRVRTYVNGEKVDELRDDLAGYELLVTYNGRCFDAPFLEARLPGLRLDMPHIDLRFLLASLGYHGGLKGCERKLGVQRPADLRDVDGLLAIRLWQAHLRGDGRALSTLLRYNV